MKSFGQLLRTYRKKCVDPVTDKPLSQEKFASLLGEEIGQSITGSTVGNWEREDTQIDKDDRSILLGMVRVFVKHGAMKTLELADEFLEAGNFKTLAVEEILRVHPEWNKQIRDKQAQKSLVQNKSSAPKLPISATAKSNIFMSPPLPPQGVVGRKNILSDVMERLMSAHLAKERATPIALLGFGGIGKTTLAISVSHHPAIREHFPDGVFWAALGPQPQTRYLLERWGQELGLDLMLERSERECSQRLRSAFDPLQALLVIDDVWDVKNSQHFFLAGPNSRTVFTTRESEPANLLTAKKNQYRVSLLDDKSSLDLLARLAPEVVTTDKKNAKALCRRLGFLPLAITLAGRLLAVEADVPGKMKRVLSELIERHEARLSLPQHEGRLGIDEDNPVSLQAILGMSIERLGKLDKERFAMLAVFGGEPLSWELSEAQYVWDCSLEETEDTIHQFVLRGLVEPREGGEYGMHALLADYAEELRISLKL